jgi:phosphatidylserine/phosphatidylglycerophosphate/cardiolipin synthase-like enzyme
MLAITDLDGFSATAPSPLLMPNVRTFYSPQDNVHAVLKTVLEAATVSVVVAMYGYDDDELAAILDRHLSNPLMHVQITLDRSQAGGVHEKALLAKYAADMTGNSVAIGTSEHSAIMHRKMAIVDGAWRISGSTNWSTSGESLQDNELTVIYAPAECVQARAILDIEHDHALGQMAARAKAAA